VLFRSLEGLAATIRGGWLYQGQIYPPTNEPRGKPAPLLPAEAFVYCIQNHDQVGNRAFGDRLSQMVSTDAYCAASALLLFLPMTPLLFMGQEWAATSPFQYFTDHDEELGKIVTEGRRREFRHFLAFVDPDAREKIPDPQAVETFQASRLDWTESRREPHASLIRLHRALLALRRDEPVLQTNLAEKHEAVALDDDTLLLRRWDGDSQFLVLACLRGAGTIDLHTREDVSLPDSMRWQVVLTTEDAGYATDAMPPEIDLSGSRPVVRFARPAAVLLKSVADKGQADGRT